MVDQDRLRAGSQGRRPRWIIQAAFHCAIVGWDTERQLCFTIKNRERNRRREGGGENGENAAHGEIRGEDFRR